MTTPTAIGMPVLQRFADDVWIVEGPDVRAMGVAFLTRMVIIKLSDGSLWINSPAQVPDDAFGQIAAIGPVRFLIAPTPLHVWRLATWHQRFPDAHLWGPPRAGGLAQAAFSAAFSGIPKSAQTLTRSLQPLLDIPPPEWATDLDQVAFKGNIFAEEVEFLHKRSRTLIVGDFIQNYPRKVGDPLGNLARTIAGVTPGGVGLDIRLSFLNRELARRSLRKLLSWDFDALIVAHGACVEQDAKAFVERAFSWLRG